VKSLFWASIVIAGNLMGARAPSQATDRLRPADSRTRVAKIDWNAPLPSASQLKQRVLDNLKKSRAEQERYVCRTTQENVETDKNGNIKKRDVRQYDVFFVNGLEIHTLTAKDGKPLDPQQKKKESERVQEKVKKDSDASYVAKKDAENVQQLDTLLHMLRFTNGHRIDVGGRPTLAYDLTGDPNVHPKGVEETFLHNMTGNIQVDEATGELVDLNARLYHDVKIGGGLLANLHKGFWIHVRQRRYPDGVWLTELVEGNGDARAALFFHPYFRFKQTMNGCALTNVTTSEKTEAVR
jgi:hypothetical protein